MTFLVLITLLVGLGSIATTAVTAETIEGRVVDSHGEPIPSVSVITNLSSVGTMTDEIGMFTLDLPRTGEPVDRVTFSSVGYHARQYDVEEVPETVVLEERYYRGTDILVRGERAEIGLTPVAFDNFSTDEIARDYTVGEFPLLLKSTPNFYAYSDGGAPLGYSYSSIRGFDDKRISTYINGVPLNDPEDQATYFVDLPDFAASIDDIQIQRGVGNSLYGDASFGGSINVAYSGLSRDRFTKLTFGYGEYTQGGKSVSDIYKQSVEYSSGLIDGRYHFTGRFSKQKTGGFRYHSWYESWAYAFSLARLDKNMTTELYIYGGPMKMHLAYWGASREAITADRRANVLGYANETDNFNQPHYHLHHTWQLRNNVTLANTFYYIRGKGFYEQYKDDRWYGDYDIDPALVNIDTDTGEPFAEGDLVRQQWVYKNQFGWNPTLTVEGDRHDLTFGGSFYYFESDHWGQVVWAQNIGGLLPPQHKYYQYYGTKYAASAFAQVHTRHTSKLSSQITAQLRYQKYDFDQEKLGPFAGHDYNLDWFFLSPRVGVNYALSDRIDLFANFAVSSRMPTDASIYDANDPYALPSLEIEAVNADSTGYRFGDALIENERVYDFELGGGYRTERLAVELNLFWMDFRNEIVPYGGLNENTGLPITVNADRSLHAGIETSASARLNNWLSLSGNFSYNHNRMKEYEANLDGFSIDLADKKLAGFPDYLGNLISDLEHGRIRLTSHVQFVGRRYMELYNVEELSLDPYVVSSLSLQYGIEDFMNLGALTFMARVDNIGDKKYEASGYGGNYAYDGGGGSLVVGGWAEYYVAPERSFFGQIQLEMF